MQIENTTPYPHFDSKFLTPQGDFLRFCVLRGTFQLVDGCRLELAPEQRGPVLVDEYYGDPKRSSLRVENDLAPYKPRADVYFVDPVTRSPSGEAERSWQVSVRLGSIRLRLRVTSPRAWRRANLGRWRLSEPAKCREVSIRFEEAYGGASPLSPANQCQENPVGRGYFLPSAAEVKTVAAPQVEAIDAPIHAIGPGGIPAGLTPIHRGWQPRASLAGTLNAAWMTTKWPLAPDDFQDAFYNCAPPELQLPGYLQGYEEVEVRAIGRRPLTRFHLPERRKPILLMYNQQGRVYRADFALDTLIVDLEADVVSLVWRAAFSTPEPVTAERLVLSEP